MPRLFSDLARLIAPLPGIAFAQDFRSGQVAVSAGTCRVCPAILTAPAYKNALAAARTAQRPVSLALRLTPSCSGECKRGDRCQCPTKLSLRIVPIADPAAPRRAQVLLTLGSLHD